MDGTSGRWRQITPSQFQWEAEALEHLRAALPDADPVRAWSNFEFAAGGTLNEVDAFVLTRKGLWFIEIKSHPGTISGSQSLWTWHRPDGSRSTFDNPVNLANRKSKRLAGLIARHWTDAKGNRFGKPPFIKPLVFLSDPDVVVKLSPDVAPFVTVRDRASDARGGAAPAGFRGVIETIATIGAAEVADPHFRQISNQDMDALVRAMDKIGIKESTGTRKVGSYVLSLPAFSERGSTQDFLAKHEQHGTERRVRIYSNVINMSPDQARTLKDAATREYLASERLHFDGVIRALDQPETDLGPAVIYDHPRSAIRLDRFLLERGDELDLAARLRIALRIADTMRRVHGRRITHRMLTPQSVWLRPAQDGESDTGEQWIPEVTDLSMAAREPGSAAGLSTTQSRYGRLPTIGVGDAEAVLADASVEPYLAPETYTAANPDGQALDVFSVGVITYLLCTDVAPASNREEMRDALGSAGLRASARVPDIDPTIDDVIREATCPVVSKRFTRMADLVAGLELAIEAAAPPTLDAANEPAPAEIDPLDAKPDDVLADRFIVKRALGKGSTARALLCADTQTDRDVVVKASLGGSADDRLRAEATVLEGLRHPAVVELYEVIELCERPALVLAFAGDRSLEVALRQDGPASPEFLQRWGTDLLEAVRYLEREGRGHRDIKPDNLGIVAQGKNNERHLVLFDLSLAAAPLSDLNAGTPGYLEPFLGEGDRKVWDLWAERYAAAVTLVEMATGELPTWGDGQTNPAFTEGEATIALEVIDPELRQPLGQFFERALRRDWTKRFDTAEDMLRAWQRAFEGLDVEHEDDGDAAAAGGAGAEAAPASSRLPEQLRLDDPVVSLGARGKVRSAIRRLGVQQVRDLADLDPASVNRTKGISPTSRKAILRLRADVLQRFADELAAAPTELDRAATTQAATEGPAAVVAADEPVAADAEGSGGTLTAARLDLDALALHLIPVGGRGKKAMLTADAIRHLLGLEPDADPGADVDAWRTTQEVAATLGASAGAVSTALQEGRALWARSAALMAVADDVVEILVDLGGVAAAGELVTPLIEARQSGADEVTARRTARAVLRAVIESASHASLPLTTRRVGPRMLLALDGVTDGHEASFDGSSLLATAADLGVRADELLVDAALVPSTEAVAALRSVPTDASSLPDGRLVRLAAAASGTAIANSASDLVRRAPGAVDALRWSRPSLVTAAGATPAEVLDRVRVRFPTAVLPEHPELDALITEAGLPLRWEPQLERYVAAAEPGALSTFTWLPSRNETLVSPPDAASTPSGAAPLVPLPASAQMTPEALAAVELEEHLLRSLRDGGFLALRVPTDRVREARSELARFQAPPHDVIPIDLEARFLHHLRRVAESRNVPWARLLTADAAPERSGDRTRLATYTRPAVDAVVDEVTSLGVRVMAWQPGALVRYEGDAPMGAIDRLRDAVASRRGGLRTLWLVVPGSNVTAKPMIDGVPVPVIGQAEWADVTDGWLRNLHRSEGAVS